ncbi:tyrosine-type recombinase/integrase [Halanaerobium congolense]|uniref:Integrase/recombinase XerD n=1 Tax=Halanaerobium congolense TaxID=54121 RepID=A0A1G6SS24_9FIRM|nr:site-specific integrase [Halanaerobium congolense]PUU88751.1 MAG: integrase family protein [Halanaerobium sp.]SDD19431.1 integrase/recombinase XerD [Halanaerobium congolense]
MNNYLDYLPEILDEYEEELLLEQPNKRCITGLRNYTLMKLILTAGLRPKEILNLNWENIDLIEYSIMIRAKNLTQNRKIYITLDAVDALREWKYRQRKEVGECSFVFTTLAGNVIKARYMRSMISRYADKAFICKDVSPYTLRHTYGAKLYNTNEDLKKVRSNLGLADSNHLKIYSILADQDVGFLY